MQLICKRGKFGRNAGKFSLSMDLFGSWASQETRLAHIYLTRDRESMSLAYVQARKIETESVSSQVIIGMRYQQFE